MMRLIKGLVSIVMAFALITFSMTAFIPTAVADETDSPSCEEGTLDVTYTELQGSERNKVVAKALSNEGVKELKQQLLDADYTPRIDDAQAFDVEVSDEGVTNELLAARIPFEPADESTPDREIIFIYDPETGESTAIIGNCFWPCLGCAAGVAACVVCAASCLVINAACVLCLLLSCPFAACSCNECCTCLAGLNCAECIANPWICNVYLCVIGCC